MALDYDSFRADIGDVNEAFADEEIDALETRAADRWGANVAYEGARLLAVNQLMANAAKRSDYTANDSSQKASQVFKNLKTLRDVYRADLYEAREDAAGSSVRMGATRKKPSRRQEYPDA